RASPRRTTGLSGSNGDPTAVSASRWNYRRRPAPTRISRPLRWLADARITKEKRDGMTAQRMDNVGIVVDDLPATIAFFRGLGLELEGRALVVGVRAGRDTGLGDQRVEIAMMRTLDGNGRLEPSR